MSVKSEGERKRERRRQKNKSQALKVDFLGGKVRGSWQIIIFEVYGDCYSIPNSYLLFYNLIKIMQKYKQSSIFLILLFAFSFIHGLCDIESFNFPAVNLSSFILSLDFMF